MTDHLNGGIKMRIRKILSLLLILLMLGTVMTATAEQVWDDDMFEQILGIEFDVGDLNGGNVAMRIVDGNIGEVSYTLQNVNGDNVRWTIRFTRNQGYASAGILSGIPESEMSAPLDLSQELSMRQLSAGGDLYFWKQGTSRFCLFIDGLYSNMQFAAQMDEIMEACE